MAWIFPRLKRKDQREVLRQDYKQKSSSFKRYDNSIDFSMYFVSSSPDPLYDDLLIDIHISVAELRPLPRWYPHYFHELVAQNSHSRDV